MSDYDMLITTQVPPTENMIQSLLQQKTIGEVALPARLPLIEPGNWFHINQPESFTFNIVPEEYQDVELHRMGFTLFNEEDIRFEFSLKFEQAQSPGGSLGIKFKDNHLNSGTITYDKLKAILLEAAEIMNASYGHVIVRYMLLDKERYPWFRYPEGHLGQVLTGWMTYFQSERVDFIGREKFEQMTTFEEKIITDEGGILLTLQREPFDFNNDAHRQREDQAIEELGLRELAEKYPVKTPGRTS